MKSRNTATRVVARGDAAGHDADRCRALLEQVGFASCLTDSRRPGPSLYVAVCGRRDAVMPRHVQKDREASLTWNLKDELLRRGKVYYAKLVRGRATFIAPRMMPYFHAIWGVRKAEEPTAAEPGRAILNVLRHEWEMGTADLRDESGVKDRAASPRARRAAGGDDRDPERRRLPADFTYIWTLGVGRFPDGCAAVSAARRRPRNRALFPRRSRADDSGRTGASDWPLPPGSWPRQPRACRRRLRDHVRVQARISPRRTRPRGYRPRRSSSRSRKSRAPREASTRKLNFQLPTSNFQLPNSPQLPTYLFSVSAH